MATIVTQVSPRLPHGCGCQDTGINCAQAAPGEGLWLGTQALLFHLWKGQACSSWSLFNRLRYQDSICADMVHGFPGMANNSL